MLKRPSGADHLRGWLVRAVLRSIGAYVVAYLLIIAAFAVLAWQDRDPDAQESAELIAIVTLGSLVVIPAVAAATALIALGLYPLGRRMPVLAFRPFVVVLLPLVFAASTAVVRPVGPLLIVVGVLGLLVAAILPHPGRYRRTDADLLRAWHLDG